MPIAFRAAGTAATADSGSVTPGLPVGTAEGDLLVLLVASRDNVAVSLPFGWNFAGVLNNGTLFRSTFAWKVAGASESAPGVVHLGGATIIAQIAGFYGQSPAANPTVVYGQQTNAGGSASIVAPTVTPSAGAQNLQLLLLGHNQNKTMTAESVGGSLPAWNEVIDSQFLGTRAIAIWCGWRLWDDLAATGTHSASIDAGTGLGNGAQLFIASPIGGTSEDPATSSGAIAAAAPSGGTTPGSTSSSGAPLASAQSSADSLANALVICTSDVEIPYPAGGRGEIGGTAPGVFLHEGTMIVGLAHADAGPKFLVLGVAAGKANLEGGALAQAEIAGAPEALAEALGELLGAVELQIESGGGGMSLTAAQLAAATHVAAIPLSTVLGFSQGAVSLEGRAQGDAALVGDLQPFAEALARLLAIAGFTVPSSGAGLSLTVGQPAGIGTMRGSSLGLAELWHALLELVASGGTSAGSSASEAGPVTRQGNLGGQSSGLMRSFCRIFGGGMFAGGAASGGRSPGTVAAQTMLVGALPIFGAESGGTVLLVARLTGLAPIPGRAEGSTEIAGQPLGQGAGGAGVAASGRLYTQRLRGFAPMAGTGAGKVELYSSTEQLWFTAGEGAGATRLSGALRAFAALAAHLEGTSSNETALGGPAPAGGSSGGSVEVRGRLPSKGWVLGTSLGNAELFLLQELLSELAGEGAGRALAVASLSASATLGASASGTAAVFLGFLLEPPPPRLRRSRAPGPVITVFEERLRPAVEHVLAHAELSAPFRLQAGFIAARSAFEVVPAARALTSPRLEQSDMEAPARGGESPLVDAATTLEERTRAVAASIGSEAEL